jgi:hypothetical protein
MHKARTVLGGAGVALAMGLMLGGAMRPNLAEDDRPAGPQTILGKSALRSTGPFDPGSVDAGYIGAIPDYVMGTDLKKAVSWPDERPAASASPRASGAEEISPVVFARAADVELPPAAARYPSLGGAPPARAPVGQAVDDVDEAPDLD